MAKKKNITSVITGDIVNSRAVNSNLWLGPLKKTLSLEGDSPKTWEIYRGDSFQIEVKNPENALLVAMRIKATIKCVKNLDVRMAIGIGEKEFAGSAITESNGEVFINSGEKLEALKGEKRNLAVKTRWPDFDTEINRYIKLALIAMDNWTTGAAQLMRVKIDSQETTQTKLAKKLGITQSSFSSREKTAYYSEIMELESFYREEVAKLLS